ncbi:MAG: outer membrane lipoprotein-sorting protein [Puniceicoccaceae bacterium]|nr:MAG: outer membrane lipoprotein-sorting protein [Puniceicoccaceae bacterium]
MGFGIKPAAPVVGNRMQRFLVLLLALAAGLAWAPWAEAQRRMRPPPSYHQPGPPDQDRGREVLETFQRMGIEGDYAFAFSLRVMPRQGGERWLAGTLFGSRSAAGPVSLVELRDAAGATSARLLLQSGPEAEAWIYRPGEDEQPRRMEAAELIEPLAETDLSAFELLTPFFFWDEFVYEGLVRFRGRPTHVFLLYPPGDDLAEGTGMEAVRVHLDGQFNAPSQAQFLDRDGQAFRTISILDLRRVDGQWIVRSIDVRDERTRDKTRFEVEEARLGLEFPGALFQPAALLSTFTELAVLVEVDREMLAY